MTLFSILHKQYGSPSKRNHGTPYMYTSLTPPSYVIGDYHGHQLQRKKKTERLHRPAQTSKTPRPWIKVGFSCLQPYFISSFLSSRLSNQPSNAASAHSGLLHLEFWPSLPLPCHGRQNKKAAKESDCGQEARDCGFEKRRVRKKKAKKKKKQKKKKKKKKMKDHLQG